MAILEKTREDFANEVGLPDLFDFRTKRAIDFSMIDFRHIYTDFYSGLKMMFKSFKDDNPCCLFLSNHRNLREIKEDEFFTGKEDKDAVYFITYSSNQGVILCRYNSAFLNQYINRVSKGEYVTSITDYQPLVLNEKLLNFLTEVKTAGIGWYLTNNPGNVVVSNLMAVQKLNSLPKKFSEVIQFIKDQSVNCFDASKYILIPNKVCWNSELGEKEASILKNGFPVVNTYLSFNECGKIYNVTLFRPDDDSDTFTPSGKSPDVFDIRYESVYWDIYKKDDIKQYFAERNIDIE